MLQWFRNLSLKSKLVLEISLLVVAVTGFLLLYFPQRQKVLALRGLENKARSLATVIADSSSTGVEFEQVSDVDAVLKVLGGERGDQDFRCFP